jgi:hypothetical protein
MPMIIMHYIPMITKRYKKRNSAFNIFLTGKVLEADSDTYGQETPDRTLWFITVATGSNARPAASSQQSHILFKTHFNIILPPMHRSLSGPFSSRLQTKCGD